MKRFIFVLLAAIMCLTAASCASFGYYKEAQNPPPATGTGDEDADTGTEEPDVPPIAPELDEMYTVTCTYNDKQYTSLLGSSATWTGSDGSVYKADFNEDGVAVCAESDEMDGDYYVDILLTTDAYVYRPDVHLATSDNKHVNVELYSCTTINARTPRDGMNGKGTFAEAALADGRVYKTTVSVNSSSSDSRSYFVLSRASQLETWCSTRENTVNPMVMGIVFQPDSGYVNNQVNVECNAGGRSGTYTKNVLLSYSLYPELDEKGVSMFYLHAAERTGTVSTVTIYFQVSSTTAAPDVVDPWDLKYEKVYIQDPTLLHQLNPKDGATFSYVYWRKGASEPILRASEYKLFPIGTVDSAGNEGDGYYHRYDAENNVYKELLFARLAKDCEVIDTEGSNHGFLYYKIDVLQNCKDYTAFFASSPTAPRMGKDAVGYAKYSQYQPDGAHPVTEELRQFLQDYALGAYLFFDGEGWAENGTNPGGLHLKANEESMWLFCCGCYDGCNKVSDFTEVNPDDV